MILCGIILGITGALFQLIKYITKFELHWLLVGLIISIISTVATSLLFGGDTRKIEIMLFLFLFYVIPSFGIFYCVQFMIYRCEKARST